MQSYIPRRSFRALIGCILSLLCAVPASRATAAATGCNDCRRGVCYDTAPTTDNVIGSPPRPRIMWTYDGSNVSLKYVTTHMRKVIMKTCAGKEFVAYQVVYITFSPVPDQNQLPIVLPVGSPQVNAYPKAVNGPSTGVWPPPGPYVNVGSNCHAETLGLGAGTAQPPPSTPPPTPPPGATVPTGGEGFWVEDAAPVFTDPCWSRCTTCSEPPPPRPQGAVVVWYVAPEARGQTDHSKGTPLHSATSNGDGTYTSKNGSEAKKSNENESHLDAEYGHEGESKNGKTIHKVVMVRDC